MLVHHARKETHRHHQEVQVGQAHELLVQVDGQEGDDGVLGRRELVGLGRLSGRTLVQQPPQPNLDGNLLPQRFVDLDGRGAELHIPEVPRLDVTVRLLRLLRGGVARRDVALRGGTHRKAMAGIAHGISCSGAS